VRRLVDQYKAALSAGTARTKRSQGRQAAPSYIADTVLHLERFATAHGRQAASAITRPEIVGLLNRYVDQPSVHRRMHGAIHRLYLWARRHGLVASNPTEDIETTAPPARERVLKLAELALIWHAASDLDPLYRDYVQLMIATGQRRTEVAGMRWGEIDLAAGLWTLPADRTKARRQHTIPLPTLAVGILEARKKTGPPLLAGVDLVLPSRSRDGKSNAPISGWAWLKRELDNRIPLPPWQMHDFRRSLVTHCAEQGADIATLDSMLNHAASMTRGGIVGVYQKATLLEPMREAMKLWNQLLENTLTGEKGKVVRLPARKH
jgi:integrase